MKPNRSHAFTLIEMLVVISIIAVLAAFAVPALTSALTRGQMTGTLNNGRQFYLAAQQMALDGAANGDATLIWPGDSNPAFANLRAYLAVLVKNDYLKPGDLTKVLSAPGSPCTVSAATDPATGNVTVSYDAGTPALKVYNVHDADASNTIFCVTKNYTYDTPLNAANSPYGDKGFIVQRKGGDANIFRKNNAAATAGQEATFQSIVGKRPGDTDGAGGVTAGDAAVTIAP